MGSWVPSADIVNVEEVKQLVDRDKVLTVVLRDGELAGDCLFVDLKDVIVEHLY